MNYRQIFFAELFGTFCLVFAGTGAIVVNHITGGAIMHPGIAMVFGLVVMSMIFAVGDVSGAHLNPAVTLAFCVTGRLGLNRLPLYWSAQLIGALLASTLIGQLFKQQAMLGATLPSGSASQSFWLELVLTGILVVVILCVSTGPKETGILAGVAIGGVIGLEAMFGGPICGASMNPARSLAPAILSGHLEYLWIYLLAPLSGAIAGAIVWALIRKPFDDNTLRAN